MAQKHPKAKRIEIEDLREISWGEWEGTNQEPGIKRLLSSWEDDRDFTAKTPLGESPVEVELRSVPEIYELIKKPGTTYCVVAHGRLLRILLSSLIHHSLEYMQTFSHQNTCINIVDVVLKDTWLSDDHLLMPDLTPNINLTSIKHPKQIQFIPILLNDARHLQ